MTTRKPTETEQVALNDLRTAHIAYVNKKMTLRQEIETEFSDRLGEYESRRTQAAHNAVSVGATGAMMLKALGLKGYPSLYAILGRPTATTRLSTFTPDTKATAISAALEERGDAWYATSPDGCTMPLLDGATGYRVDEKPGPEGKEWETVPILPTPEWVEWFDVNADAIREYASGSR